MQIVISVSMLCLAECVAAAGGIHVTRAKRLSAEHLHATLGLPDPSLCAGGTRVRPNKESSEDGRAKQESGQSAPLVTEFLSVLLKKALSENQRGFVAELEHTLKIIAALEEGGDATSLKLSQVQKELFQARISRLGRETAYRDAIDEYKQRFDLSSQRMKEIEEIALLPITRHLPRFEDVNASSDAALEEISKKVDPNKPTALREVARSVFTTSALVNGTRFHDQIMDRWKPLADLSEEKLHARRRQYDEEHRQLLDMQSQQEIAGKHLMEEQQRRLRELDFQIRLSDFERNLRLFESAPWKKLSNDTKGDRERARIRDEVVFAFATVLVDARNERLDMIAKSWPRLAAVQFKGVDLLTCEPDKAERLVSELPDRDAALAARRQLRRMRQLADSYPMQQKAVLLAFVGAEGARKALITPPPPSDLPPALVPKAEPRELVGAQRALAQRRAQILTTWVEFQIARLKVYSALGTSPP